MIALQADDPRDAGPFRLVARLGAGGMGQVYLGVDTDARRVAVKVVHPGLAHDERFRARFAREVELGKRVDAPWTAAVIDADPDAPRPWLATQYVPGPPLDHAVRAAGVLSRDDVHALAVRLAQALAGIHEAGLVHRDVKPSNVLLAADGPRLIDFGIAQAVDGTRMTSTGMMIGTPAFMSPEQADGAQLGPASDVFSLGAVLVFAATGDGPFGQGAPVVLLRRILTAPADLGATAEPVRGLAAQCLARDPADRPTAAELAAELSPEPASTSEGWLRPAVAGLVPELDEVISGPARPDAGAGRTDSAASSVSEAGEAPPPTRGGRRIRRRALLTGGALAGLGLVGGVGAAIATGRTAAVPWGPQPAVRWSYTAGGDLLTLATDGATVFATGTDSAVYALDTAMGQPRWTHAIGDALTFGSDAKSLVVVGPTVYTTDGYNSYAIDTASGSRRWMADGARLLVAGPTAVICTGHTFEPRQGNTVIGLDPTTGAQRWTRYGEDLGLGTNDVSLVAVLSAHAVHLVENGTLVTLDAATGATLWNRPLTYVPAYDGIRATPDTVYATDPISYTTTRVLALDARTGAERWNLNSPPGGTIAPVPRLVSGNTVYGCGFAEMAAWDATTGEQRWTWSDAKERGQPLLPDEARSLVGPAIFNESLVVLADTTPSADPGSNTHNVVISLDAAAGTSRWRLPLPPYVPRSPDANFGKHGPVVAADGTVVVTIGSAIHAITV